MRLEIYKLYTVLVKILFLQSVQTNEETLLAIFNKLLFFRQTFYKREYIMVKFQIFILY